MQLSLKGQNNLSLLGVMAANVALFYAVLRNDAVLSSDWIALFRDLESALPAGLAVALTGVINAQLTPTAKARLVYFRWNNPLPGSEAFTRYATSDERIDREAIQRMYGPLPVDPRKQNQLWYSLYRSVETDTAVMQVHKAFLFTRDYACLALLLLLSLGIGGFAQIPSSQLAFLYFSALVLQLVLALRAARNNGRRFVTTVLARVGSRRSPDPC